MFKELRTILMLLFFMLLMMMAWCLSGCTRTVSEVVEKKDTVYVDHAERDSSGLYHNGSMVTDASFRDSSLRVVHDTVEKVAVQKDSVFVRDSVHVREKGDSVYVYKERWNTRLVVSHDTVLKVRTDTVMKIVTDTVLVVVKDTVRTWDHSAKDDSTFVSKQDNEKVVKEKRDVPWLKILGALLFLSGVVYIWRLSKK